MMRVAVGVVALVVCFAGAVLARAQAPAPDGPALMPSWTLTTGFSAPESAFYDPASKSVFVSSINGPILDKDGNGYISRLTETGTVVAEKWVGGLNAPKGLRGLNGTLWAADIDEVVGIDIATGRVTSRVAVAGAQFLNDLATAPDGTIYVSDSNLARVYQVRGGQASVFVEGGGVVEQPNGLLVDGGRLILGSIGPVPQPGARAGGPGAGGHLFAFDLRTKARTTLTTERVGGIDGIESDGRGGWLVTDVIGARLLHVAPSGALRVLAKFPMGGADFGYIPGSRTAIVPFLFGNRVSAYDLTAALR